MPKLKHDSVASENRVVNYSKGWFERAANLIEMADLYGSDVIELGSASCEFSEIMRDRFDMKVTCVDYVDGYVDLARQKGFEAYNIDLDSIDMSSGNEVPSLKRKYDLVIMLEVIEHIFSTEDVLAFIHSILKPGGKLIITTPNIGFIGHRLYSIMNGNMPHAEGHHIRFFDEQKLRSSLFLSGFDDDWLSADAGFGFQPDRIFGPGSHVPRKLGTLFLSVLSNKAFNWIVPRRQRYSGLSVLVSRDDVDPLPHSWQGCEKLMQETSPEKSETTRQRLIEATRRGYLDRSPLFRSFVASISGDYAKN